MAPPKRRQCATMVVDAQLAEAFPSYRGNQDRIEQGIRRSIGTGQALRALRKLLTIDVVVHVVYKLPAENISDAQIKSQIAVLNKDFRATNPDKSKVPPVWKGLVGDANLKFQLAKKDPSGKATTGITRTATTRDSFGSGNAVKKKAQGGADAWASDRYLNIWVCNLATGSSGTPSSRAALPTTDGVVILYTAFGTSGAAAAPFNLGRTATHEVGHWLNLRHIWGDRNDCGGTDFVTDTPNQQLPNTGKPAFPHVSCNNGPNGDMFMNYMDYVDDNAMFMFTPAQVLRMNATLAGPRKKVGK